MANLLKLDRPGNLEFVLELLNSGCAVGLPTETVYGLAARMDLAHAVASVFQLKNRPHFDPLIVHVLNHEAVSKIAKNISADHQKLMTTFWPGPLTILFERSESVSDLVTASSEFVAVRSPRHPTFRKILENLNFPYLVAPSANRFTSVSPTCAQDVLDELGPHGLEAVVDGGACELGVESTVVKLTHNGDHRVLEILRPGALGVLEIQNCLGSDVEIQSSHTPSTPAPGTHRLHYSPGIPAYFFENESEALKKMSAMDLSQTLLIEITRGSLMELRQLPWKEIVVLGQDLNEAAQNIFPQLRRIGRERPQAFVAVAGNENGLGLAINDRLRRSAGKI